ncbi:hypothetical protein ABT187_48555 [Streptomyces sp. NPDC001817]|uniref:hypothetical protein n=1 Tax=Streptomyces sp. NPDC001817 TaxID=3154398 RepID=UPI00332DCC3B
MIGAGAVGQAVHRPGGFRPARAAAHRLPRPGPGGRHLALVLRGRHRDPRLDDKIVAAAISTHCLDISEPKTVRGLEFGYRL